MDSSETRHWFKLPVPLTWLCGLDDQPANNALTDAFGDRYLYAHNPIFRKIRDAAIGFGYRFSSEDTPLWRDYQMFPLTTLHRILEEKTIPYLNNFAAVRSVLSHNPQAALTPGFLGGSLRHNHAFHESAHCVAHECMRRMESDLRAVAPAQRDRFVLEALLAESAANTVERLGSLWRRMPVSDALFYMLNSYVSGGAGTRALREISGAECADFRTFLVLFLASFEANLTAEKPVEATYERISTAVECPDEELAGIRTMTDIAFGLSTNFRENTNPMYFSLLGYKAEFASLVESAWLSRPEQQQFVREFTRTLFETIDI